MHALNSAGHERANVDVIGHAPRRMRQGTALFDMSAMPTNATPASMAGLANGSQPPAQVARNRAQLPPLPHWFLDVTLHRVL